MEQKKKTSVKDRVVRFFKAIWQECKDVRTVVVLVVVIVVMYSPVWLGYWLFALFGWGWCAAVAGAYALFWAGPFTPFFPLCIAIALWVSRLLFFGRKK